MQTLRDRWIEALYSGTYTQGIRQLRGQTGEMCCLGVLCDLVDPENWDHPDAATPSWDNHSTQAPKRIAAEAGLFPLDQTVLYYLNDHYKFTFEEIADYIQHCEAAGVSLWNGAPDGYFSSGVLIGKSSGFLIGKSSGFLKK
jgi:hypothetical protein